MSLVDFITMEFIKVKGNRTFLITVIGALIIPILMAVVNLFIGGISMVDSLKGVFSFYLQSISIIFTAVIINYLFTIDLETHTLKSIIPLPISRREYIVGKLLTLLVWMLVLSLITIIVSVILFPLVGASGFDLIAILKESGLFLVGTALLFLVMIPVAFVTVATNNTSAGLIASVLILFSTMLPLDQLEYDPWILPYKVAFGSDFNLVLALAIIVLVGILGYGLLRWVFYKRDIQL
jgi:bacitracin transport system permease protein